MGSCPQMKRIFAFFLLIFGQECFSRPSLSILKNVPIQQEENNKEAMNERDNNILNEVQAFKEFTKNRELQLGDQTGALIDEMNQLEADLVQKLQSVENMFAEKQEEEKTLRQKILTAIKTSPQNQESLIVWKYVVLIEFSETFFCYT